MVLMLEVLMLLCGKLRGDRMVLDRELSQEIAAARYMTGDGEEGGEVIVGVPSLLLVVGGGGGGGVRGGSRAIGHGGFLVVSLNIRHG